jgi:ubiquinone/menaquinone biosynthesis C-methylase UbiE
MADQFQERYKGQYGIDAPYLLPLAGLICAANFIVAAISQSIGPLIGASAVLLCVGCGLHTSRRGKFLAWTELLDRLHLRGDERILDLGCGRGAVLLAAAKRVPSGRAFGVDIWKQSDQSGNSVNATRRNAQAEGVSDRVDVLTANLTALPFPAETFDLVVSNVAIHNIKGQTGRAMAVAEAARVLRPGGRLLLADLSHTSVYARQLAQLGMADVGRRSLGWRMWWSGPWMAPYLVSATKARNAKASAA